MNILFVIRDISFADHVSVAHLSAIAKSLGHSTHLCILSKDNFDNSIEETSPDIVAYSANVADFDEMVEKHKGVIKEHNFVSIMGGPQPTFSPETFGASGMDAYCIGEGDYVFKDFIERVAEGVSFDDIPNLITKNGKNEIRDLIRDLDDLPIADRDLTLSNSNLKDIPKKTFYATRGCPYRCSYCCNCYYNDMYKGKGPVLRRFSVERVIQEIERVRDKYKMDFVKFGDDIFVIKADDWLREFAEKYSKRIGVPFNCYLRFDIINEDVLKLLQKAGCYSVHLSLDSTSEYVREKILNRKMRKIDIEEKLRQIRSYGINTWVNFMLALPESSLQDDIDTISLGRRAKVSYLSYTTAVPMKGTYLYDYCVSNKFIDPSYNSDMSDVSHLSVLSCFDKKEKNIRYNIYLLGAIISRLPFWLQKVAIQIIKVVPPNSWFLKLRHKYFDYSISHLIYKLPDETKFRDENDSRYASKL